MPPRLRVGDVNTVQVASTDTLAKLDRMLLKAQIGAHQAVTINITALTDAVLEQKEAQYQLRDRQKIITTALHNFQQGAAEQQAKLDALMHRLTEYYSNL